MIRIGHGFDVHKFGGEGPVIIGGVAVPYEQGLLATQTVMWPYMQSLMLCLEQLLQVISGTIFLILMTSGKVPTVVSF